MALTEKTINDVLVLSVNGRMVGGPETKEVSERVRNLVEGGARNVVLELSGVPWMNSTGLGALMESRRIITEQGGVLKLAGMAEKIKSLFIMTQTLSLYELHPTADAAVASFGKS